MNCGCTDVGNINQVKAVKENMTYFKGNTFESVTYAFWSDDAETIPINVMSDTFEANIWSGNTKKFDFTVDLVSPNKVKLTALNGVIPLVPGITYKWYLKRTAPNITTYRYGDFRIAQ